MSEDICLQRNVEKVCLPNEAIVLIQEEYEQEVCLKWKWGVAGVAVWRDWAQNLTKCPRPFQVF